MKNVRYSREHLNAFVDELYADGKKPCERFGMSWDELSKIEAENPALTCKTLAQENLKRA